MKEFLKLVKIWRSSRQEYGALFFFDSQYILSISITLLCFFVQLQESTDKLSFCLAVGNLTDLIDVAGCVGLSQSVVTRDKLLNSLLHFYCIARVVVATNQ